MVRRLVILLALQQLAAQEVEILPSWLPAKGWTRHAVLLSMPPSLHHQGDYTALCVQNADGNTAHHIYIARVAPSVRGQGQGDYQSFRWHPGDWSPRRTKPTQAHTLPRWPNGCWRQCTFVVDAEPSMLRRTQSFALPVLRPQAVATSPQRVRPDHQGRCQD